DAVGIVHGVVARPHVVHPPRPAPWPVVPVVPIGLVVHAPSVLHAAHGVVPAHGTHAHAHAEAETAVVVVVRVVVRQIIVAPGAGVGVRLAGVEVVIGSRPLGGSNGAGRSGRRFRRHVI